jgi:tetratricopeptide (TPR) repeat protein
MVKKQQFIVIGSIVILMGLLLSLEIKGLVKPTEQNDASGSAASSATQTISIESVSTIAKQGIDANLAQEITAMEARLKNAGGAEKIALQKDLAQKWDDVAQPAPAALYYEAVAQAEITFENWLKAGNLFTSAYQSSQDSLMQTGLIQKAISSYQKAIEKNPNSLDAKTGLGVAYVSGGTQGPMQGIQLLQGVVKEDPKNTKANMALGRFSMQSGQYEKAIERFKTVIEQKPDLEAYFLLATSYESLGMNTESIAAYEKSKSLGADPNLTKFVDGKIEELRKN